MAKRKAGVNDIIYELDNDDIEISSEDEAKGNKIKCFEKEITHKSTESPPILNPYIEDVIVLNSSMDESCNTESESNSQNGGKNSPNAISIDNDQSTNNDETDSMISQTTNKDLKKNPETIILNEDITVDSPGSINELVEIGCENRKPLITVHFRNLDLANKYKNKIKVFIIDLLKLDDEKTDLSENETELDLEIWPEDLSRMKQETQEIVVTDNLFFVDTDPNEEAKPDIPKYTQGSGVISNEDIEAPEPTNTLRRGPICFNCDGDHYLRDCQLPRNNTRIAGKRKNITNKLGRYHVEDEQKYGHLIPGRISSQLRHALGLKRYELPLHIYRMRMLGYPPGWLEEARISYSGITMFDSAGNEILDGDDEVGQIYEAGSKDKFDIKKILDFPGFNVPASSRYKEEGDMLGMPPMSEDDSKLLMLQTLAPNAMKAYKRKKLTFFPSGTPNTSIQNSQAEMELDSGDEALEFPSVPPLPDDDPPPPPPPPEIPPPPPENPPPPPESPPPILSSTKDDTVKVKSNDDEDVEIISMCTVADIPVPEEDLIVIDEVMENVSQCDSGRSSPSLDDLEDKKRKLLDALGGEMPSPYVENEERDENAKQNESKVNDETSFKESKIGDKTGFVETANTFTSSPVDNVSTISEASRSKSPVSTPTAEASRTNAPASTPTAEAFRTKTPASTPTAEASRTNTPASTPTAEASRANTPVSTPTAEACRTKTAGTVKTTLYGTPVLNTASSYNKLPSDDKFAKDICDVINFENLPNSTGKYKKICTLLKKVKSEVDRIQES